jgi:6-phosphogluconate dehydrogenase
MNIGRLCTTTVHKIWKARCITNHYLFLQKISVAKENDSSTKQHSIKSYLIKDTNTRKQSHSELGTLTKGNNSHIPFYWPVLNSPSNEGVMEAKQ